MIHAFKIYTLGGKGDFYHVLFTYCISHSWWKLGKPLSLGKIVRGEFMWVSGLVEIGFPSLTRE